LFLIQAKFDRKVESMKAYVANICLTRVIKSKPYTLAQQTIHLQM